MLSPRISIITPTHNRAGFLSEALENIRRQAHSNLEILIIDDGSQDETPDILHNFADLNIRYFPLPHSGHLSKLRNFGIEKADGDYIAFLDSDDLWVEGKLKAELTAMNDYPEAGFAFCGFETFDGTGSSRIELYRDLAEPELQLSVQSIFRRLIEGRMILYPSTVVLRKSVLTTTGLIDSSLRVGDYEFFTRLAHQFPAAIVHSPLVRIRKHPGNLSLQFEKQDLKEAILTVQRRYAQGQIPRHIHDERILKYCCDLARASFAKGERALAKEQLLTCLSLVESSDVPELR